MDGTPQPQPSVIRQRYALLIGVREYVDPSCSALPHTVHDVTALDTILRKAGYTVRLLHDDQTELALKPTRENIWDALEQFAQTTGPGDLLLVHFGGHGVLHEGKAYLLASNSRKASLARTGIDLGEFNNILADAGAQAKILLLDACHAGIGRSSGGMDPAFERHVYLEATGMATLAACRQHEIAYDHHEQKHGAFTYHLLQGLQGQAAGTDKHFVTFNDLAAFTTHAVKQWGIEHGYQQWPNANTQLVGDPAIIELSQTNPSQWNYPNPFTTTGAIHEPTYFIGRTAELRRLNNMLSGGSVALLGVAKVGKSSLLRHLARQWSGPVLGPIDCMGIQDRDDFYQQLAEWLQLTNATWRNIDRELRQKPALLLLDELDVAPEWGLTADDLRRLRALCDANRSFKVVTVSRIPLKQMFPTKVGSEPYNLIQPLTLGLLTNDEARQLLAHPWAPEAPLFDAATCEQLCALATNHPFQIQRAAFHRYESLYDPYYPWEAAYEQDLEHML